MERPKHRWLIVLGALLACGLLLLLGRQHLVSKSSEQLPAHTSVTPTQVAQPQAETRAAAKSVQAAPTNAQSAAASTKGGTFRGRVIDAVTRQSVREFEVRLIRIDRDAASNRWQEPIVRPFKSSSGRFAWSNLQPSRWVATISAPDHQQFEVPEFTTVADKSAPELVIPLLRGFTVRGRVFDVSTGAGIADAYVRFAKPDLAYHGVDMFQPSARSKLDGTFELDGLPAGETTLSAFAQGYTSGSQELVVNDQTQPVDFGLSTGGSIAGRLVTSAGAPIKGLVMLDGADGGIYQTDDNGMFSFGGLPAGSYVLSSSTSAGSARKEIVLASAERRADVTLTTVVGRTVRGTIRGLRSDQLKEAFLWAQPQSQAQRQFFHAQPDEQGAYALRGLSTGQLLVTAGTSARRLAKTIDVPADKDVVLDFVFPPGARLSGRVTQGGKPDPGRLITMAPAETKSQIAYQAMSAADGQYEFEGLAPGEYRLRARDDIGRTVTIAGDVELNIDIPSVQVGGRVLEDVGSIPVVDADIYIRGSDTATARVHSWKKSDHFGEFKLTGVEPGDVELIVYKPGYELYREKITYSAPITGKTIRLRKGSGVEIHAQRSTQGEPLQGFYVSDKSSTNDWSIEHWVPLDRNGVGFIPNALSGNTLVLNAYVGKPVEIPDWDGSPLDVKF